MIPCWRGQRHPLANLSSREVCCLLGAQIRDVVEGLPGLVQPSDCYPCCCSTWASVILSGATWRASSDYRDVGVVVKGLGALVMFSSEQVNSWLQSWCWRKGFGFYHHGILLVERRLLGRDGIYLTKPGKETSSASSMADLTRRASE